VFTYNAGTMKLYYDGTEVGGTASGTATGNVLNFTEYLRIGDIWFDECDEYMLFDGKLDESRISNSARSAAWIKATYESGRDHLVDFGSEETPNYELDLEIQWTNVPYNLPSAELCIFGGTMGSEDLRVDFWNSTAWQNLLTDLTSGWNNVSVSSYLTSQNFTIRFKGGTETNDTVQDSWIIDVALLHAWSNEYIAEVEFIGSSNTENWNLLNWTVNSAWTTSSVNVTLQLYNYTLRDYPTSGNGYIAYTSDSTPNTDENKSQTINVNPTDFRNSTGYWKVKAKGVKAGVTQFDSKADLIELKTDKDGGTFFTFKNEGSLTLHLVSLWINNSTHHQRYDINIFINSGDTAAHTYTNVILPDKPYNVKVITERGNTAVSASD
jgi:hypothetical protein